MDVLERRLYKGASEIDEVFGVVSSIIFGRNFDWEISESAKDELVMKITGCPLLNEAKNKERDIGGLSRACEIYCISVVENLNPKCTQRFTKRMCAGDDYCENVITIVK